MANIGYHRPVLQSNREETGIANKITLIDTTLRDGEQSPDIVLSKQKRLAIAKLLFDSGFDIVEAGIPAIGHDEIDMILEISELKAGHKIAAWNRMNCYDIEQSFDCEPDIIHISVPASDLMLTHLMKKDRNWLISEMIDCVALAKEKGYNVSVGFQDASRADLWFLLELSERLYQMDVSFVRLSDTVGLYTPSMVREAISFLKENCDMAFGLHTHNDFGMAVANSAAAAVHGFEYIDTTLFGVGERAGNCDSYSLRESLGDMFDIKPSKDEFLNTRNLAKSILFAENNIDDWAYAQ